MTTQRALEALSRIEKGNVAMQAIRGYGCAEHEDILLIRDTLSSIENLERVEGEMEEIRKDLFLVLDIVQKCCDCLKRISKTTAF